MTAVRTGLIASSEGRMTAAHLLVPNASFAAWLVAVVLAGVLLALLPLVHAIRRRAWPWVIAIVLLGPIAGVAWWAVTYNERRSGSGRQPEDARG